MYRIYQIKQGDTLQSILDKFKTTEAALKKINGLTGNIEVIPGNYIIVPVRPDDLFDIYRIQRGDTLYALANKYNTTVRDLSLLNGIDSDDYIYPGQELIVPNNGVHFYMTNEGDSLLSASEKLGTNPGAVVLQNETIYLLPEQLLVYQERSSTE